MLPISSESLNRLRRISPLFIFSLSAFPFQLPPTPLYDLESITLPYSAEEFSVVVDVRSPSEFADDHLPQAINLPVLSDEERAEVGALYKRDQFAARALGVQYISTNIANHLAILRCDWPRKHIPLLYCWRGGLRSRSFAFILRSIGWRARILQGGYKAYRKHVSEELVRIARDPLTRFHILAGLTGCGKTRLLRELKRVGAATIDLEEIAHHRGSLLGNLGLQPSQKLFESRLLEGLLRCQPGHIIHLEAESNRIGNVAIPPALWKRMGESPVTEVDLPLHSRAELLLQDYPQFTENPDELSRLLDELRRLRGHAKVNTWQRQIQDRDWSNFLISILRDHYDLAYRRAGSEKSNYQIPTRLLKITDASEAAFAEAAQTLCHD